MNKLLSAAALLGTVLHAGCGGTIDLAKLRETEGAGATSSSSAAGARSMTFSSAGVGAQPGGGNSYYPQPPGDPGGQGGYAAGMGETGGSGGYAAGMGETGGSGGYAAGMGETGGLGGMDNGENTHPCMVDDDCTECTMQYDPKLSGCYLPCCATTAMTRAACEQNWQNFMTLCPIAGCAAACLEPPKPVCLNGQCVHAP